MNRLHAHGLISDPVNKNKSVWVTDEGLARGRQIADRLFGMRTPTDRRSESDS
ncbi:DUF6429 family protein [Pseudomonas sp. PS01301]|uniref:DUF6429 family protein n=1 Tax=Pseudomonas sp. PS01301 TaxID=2991437 RepID=UPI00249AB13D|nr:DUF6429 family protein [Pseudomonas sp. PS01301]